jgi:hypothetical protein
MKQWSWKWIPKRNGKKMKIIKQRLRFVLYLSSGTWCKNVRSKFLLAGVRGLSGVFLPLSSTYWLVTLCTFCWKYHNCLAWLSVSAVSAGESTPRPAPHAHHLKGYTEEISLVFQKILMQVFVKCLVSYLNSKFLNQAPCYQCHQGVKPVFVCRLKKNLWRNPRLARGPW